MAYGLLAVLLACLSQLLVTNLSKSIDYFLLGLYEREGGISSNVLYIFYQVPLAWANWHATIVPATGKLRQENSKFEPSLGDHMTLSLVQKK